MLLLETTKLKENTPMLAVLYISDIISSSTNMTFLLFMFHNSRCVYVNTFKSNEFASKPTCLTIIPGGGTSL